MFFVYWTCPNCQRNHRFVWENWDGDACEDGEFITMHCGEGDEILLGMGCGHAEKMQTMIVRNSDGIRNGFALVMSDEQIFDPKPSLDSQNWEWE